MGQCSGLSFETSHNTGRLLKSCKSHWILMLKSDYIAQLVNGSDSCCVQRRSQVFSWPGFALEVHWTNRCLLGRGTRALHKPGVTSLQRGEKCICMISSPGARLQNSPVTNLRGQAAARRALGDGSGRGVRVKTSPVMESKAEPSLGSCGSIIATLCDVAMAARAVPAWFPGV